MKRIITESKGKEKAVPPPQRFSQEFVKQREKSMNARNVAKYVAKNIFESTIWTMLV